MKLVFPSTDIVPCDLQRHFIRGYFDGDGAVYLQKTKRQTKTYIYPYVSIVGNMEFLTGLEKTLPVKSSIRQSKNKIPELRLTNMKSVVTFCEWIYPNATIFLDRKRNRFTEYSSFGINEGQ
jgi:hypothetical protein